jgi:hypothetical protein
MHRIKRRGSSPWRSRVSTADEDCLQEIDVGDAPVTSEIWRGHKGV